MKSEQRLTLCLVFGLSILAVMGISSLIPALPLLCRTFDAPVEDAWTIIAFFALPALIGTPLAGVWADRFGRKAVLLPSLGLFALGALGCMAATSLPWLLAFRAVQGLGSAPLGLLYSTIIADTWEGGERAKVMGYNGMVLGLGTAASPALGGALAMLDWRAPFLLPLLALPLAGAALRLSLARPAGARTLKDYFISVRVCAAEPRTLTLLCLTLLAFTMLSGPIITCFPILAEQAYAATPLQTGLIIAAASLSAGLAASQLHVLYRRFPSRIMLMTGFFCYGLAFCLIPACPAFSPLVWWLILPVLCFGAGQGLCIPLILTLLTGQAGASHRAALMAANAMLLRLAQNFGPWIFGALVLGLEAGGAILVGSLLALTALGLAWKAPLPSVVLAAEKGAGLETPL